MAFEAAQEAGTFLSEYGRQKHEIETATRNSVQEMVERGELRVEQADAFFVTMLLHTRTSAFRLWEAMDTPVSPPIPERLF
ncbi:hypothetical protein A2881_00200 [Candidatus Peribacteria bacterium RIFCSPHIGHO2_01_FULL_55_13]|nr:MAG: hypothetical protein A2881_00200 [Candidatus Peribacteria bacterium RIFCSPHIGHO2_01_FULL_55_13]OGJ65276.1 MAG: hypothetical protein A3F36_00350 [Candidatus Peribacteria bacterium RIFCSPHIGHO2_12_FULL_55_11]